MSPASQHPQRRKRFYILSMVMLLALISDRLLLRPTTAVADDFHAKIRASTHELPLVFGEWMGLEVPIPEAAVKMLHANFATCRRYENLRTGERATLLLVQVSDARDIIGHYPPVCYPAQGWLTRSTTPTTWQDGSNVIQGVNYVFGRDRVDGPGRILVSNFLFLPGGETCRGMDEIERAAQSRVRKLYGAGQFQVIFDSPVADARRDEIVREFIAMVRPVTNATVSEGSSHASK
jgi:hypothetical protein